MIFVVEPIMRTAGTGAVPRPSTAPDGWVAMTREGSEGEVIVVVQGRIEGIALDVFGAVLDAAARGSAPAVHVDLAAVTHWSLLAQAMVLTTGRRLSRRGAVLVLLSPAPALRAESRALSVFERVMTLPAGGT